MSALHPASHFDDTLSGHRHRLVAEHRTRGVTRHLFQDAEAAFMDTWERTWRHRYDGSDDDNKELYRFFRDVVCDLTAATSSTT